MLLFTKRNFSRFCLFRISNLTWVLPHMHIYTYVLIDIYIYAACVRLCVCWTYIQISVVEMVIRAMPFYAMAWHVEMNADLIELYTGLSFRRRIVENSFSTTLLYTYTHIHMYRTTEAQNLSWEWKKVFLLMFCHQFSNWNDWFPFVSTHADVHVMFIMLSSAHFYRHNAILSVSLSHTLLPVSLSVNLFMLTLDLSIATAEPVATPLFRPKPNLIFQSSMFAFPFVSVQIN